MFGATLAISQLQRLYNEAAPGLCGGAPYCYICHNLVHKKFLVWLLDAQRDALDDYFSRRSGVGWDSAQGVLR